MPRHQQRFCLEVADVEHLAICKQMIELAAVRQETAFEIEQFLEHRLHFADMRADGNLPARLPLSALPPLASPASFSIDSTSVFRPTLPPPAIDAATRLAAPHWAAREGSSGWLPSWL